MNKIDFHPNGTIIHSDYRHCYDIIPEHSVDLVVIDPPYLLKADENLDFGEMWRFIRFVGHPKTVVCVIGINPFISKCIISNLNSYRYDLTWNMKRVVNPFLARKRPLRSHSIISIFYDVFGTFHQYKHQIPVKPAYSMTGHLEDHTIQYNGTSVKRTRLPVFEINQKSVIDDIPVQTNFSKDSFGRHPNQKPIALYSRLIQMYSNPNDVVMDFFAGSGTCGIACIRNHRRFIMIEIIEKYFSVIKTRIDSELSTFKDEP